MMRRTVSALAAAVLVLAGAVTFAAPAVAAAPVTPSTTGCTTSQLKLAPHVSGDNDPNGHPISISPGPQGMFVPVILVHGWNGDPGNFTHKIDLTSNRGGTVTSRTSLVGQLQDMAGSAVYTFDYHQWSDRWVTDSHIAPTLATAIDCLYKATGQKVILVAHSMGGLAIEKTFSKSIAGYQNRASEISTVVTLGTPYKGSVIDSLAHGAVLNAQQVKFFGGKQFVALVTAILAECGKTSTVNADNVCTTGRFSGVKPVTTLFTAAANALQYGSAQIRSLPAMPDSIHLVQLAGYSDFGATTSWFRENDTAANTLHLGDQIVTADSAIPSPTRDNNQATCEYTLNPFRAAGNSIGVDLGVVSKIDAKGIRVPLLQTNSPCFHGDLMQDIELTNDTLGAVYDDINARVQAALKAVAASITVPAGVCTSTPIPLSNGVVTLPDTQGDGYVRVPQINDAGTSNIEQSIFIADGRSQITDSKYKGAIAIEFGCSESGVGGEQSYIGVFTNNLQPVGVVSGYPLTTASGAGQPIAGAVSFVGGKLRAEFGWLAQDTSPGANFANCPYTKVQTDYTISPGTNMSHGPLTTVEGDATCG